MLYVIENIRTGELVTGTKYDNGINEAGYYKQLYNMHYQTPVILNDGDCAAGIKKMALEIYNRRINMDRHRLRALYLDVRECKSKNKEVKTLLNEWDQENKADK